MGSIFPIYFNLSSFANNLLDNLRKGLRFFVHVARVIAHYIYKYLVLAYNYLKRYYYQFQKDPLTTIQFAGSLAILAYYSLL